MLCSKCGIELDRSKFLAKTGREYKSCNICRCRHASLNKDSSLKNCKTCGATPEEVFERSKKIMIKKFDEQAKKMMKEVFKSPQQQAQIDLAYRMAQNKINQK